MSVILTGLRCASRAINTAPATEPVTLSEVKDHLRIHWTDEDTMLTRLITVAREAVEQWTNRALITQTWQAYYDGLGRELILPKPKAQSVTHVKYYDTTGVATTINTSVYESDLISEPGYITTAYGQSWPSFTARSTRPVEVQFVAGYGAANTVPEPIKSAILLTIGHYYKHTEGVVVEVASLVHETLPLGIMRLLDNYRVQGTE